MGAMGGPRQRIPGRSLRDLKKEIDSKNRPTEAISNTKSANPQGPVSEPWAPSAHTAWRLLLSIRLCAAVWSGISDCDETYNYWEPTHQLIYGQGLQTWEYDPRFALRSYLYLLVHAVPAWLYARLLQPNPMLVFYTLRCLLGCLCATAEVYFYCGVLTSFGTHVGRLCLGLLGLSAGMFLASTALLPSTTSLYLTLIAYGAWFSHQYRLAIFATAFSALLSWPFAALLGVPIAIDIVFRKGLVRLFVVWCLISAATIAGPMMLCDSYYYGRPVLAPLNIIKYNVFTSHGPDLYGTEPASYYLLNGLLNFNLAFPAALLVIPAQLLLATLLRRETPADTRNTHILSQCGLYLWLGVFWSQPHKEERFLFPAYPLLALAAAITIDAAQKLAYYLIRRTKANHYLKETGWLAGLALLTFSLLSVSRVVAVYQNYRGSLEVWMRVAQLEEQPTLLCVGKEWHRFPSSFFLPSTAFRLGFLQSEFRGQLPKYYERPASGELATRLVHADFNDENLEETSRYISHAGKCNFLVDLENGEVTDRQPSYTSHSNWTVEAQYEYLDPRASHPLFRAFYVPLLSRRYCRYNQYVLLRRTTPRRIGPAED